MLKVHGSLMEMHSSFESPDVWRGPGGGGLRGFLKIVVEEDA
jgi:hypothetical protein